MIIVLFYAVLGGMKGITYTQVAQYCILIFAFMVPAIFISIQMTGNPIPQLGFGGESVEGGYLLDKLDGLNEQLGFNQYTDNTKPLIDALRQYHRKYNEKMKMFGNKPVRDWSSHACDSARYMAMSINDLPNKQRPDQKTTVNEYSIHGE